jgi:DNA-binding HxlR family transcriptional regulator
MTARARDRHDPAQPSEAARGPEDGAGPARTGDTAAAGDRAADGIGGLGAALDRVGDRWSLLVVEALLDGPRRFGELEAALPGIAPNILSDRLRRLERDGITRSTPYSTRPTRLAYALTADGAELAGALRLLADWGARTADRPEALRHETCGTPLEARWYCPTCARAVDDVDPEGLTRL